MGDPEATSPGGGEELERAGDSARSSIGVDAETEAREYLAADRDETARVNEFNRQEFWKDLVHAIRTSFVITLAGICWLSVIGIAGATLFIVLLLIAIVVAHYLIPQWQWLKPEELAVLGKWYANSAQFIVPLALISNAWLVAYISIRRWRETNNSGTRDR